METKWIRHPLMPDGQEVEVPAQSVSHYAHSGWEVMDEPPEWSTVRPEDAAMEELTTIAREAAGMPEPPAKDDKASDSKSAPVNDESGDEPDEPEDKPTDSKRSRRAPSKEADK